MTVISVILLAIPEICWNKKGREKRIYLAFTGKKVAAAGKFVGSLRTAADRSQFCMEAPCRPRREVSYQMFSRMLLVCFSQGDRLPHIRESVQKRGGDKNAMGSSPLSRCNLNFIM